MGSKQEGNTRSRKQSMSTWKRECITIFYTVPDDIACSFGLKKIIIHNVGGTVSLVRWWWWWWGEAKVLTPAKRHTYKHRNTSLVDVDFMFA
jgi:hypothetical protein